MEILFDGMSAVDSVLVNQELKKIDDEMLLDFSVIWKDHSVLSDAMKKKMGRGLEIAGELQGG